MRARLQKILARAGVASRRAAEELILAGRVSVGGQVVTALGTQASPDDEVCLDGRPIKPPEEKRYLMLHKPAGYVTTARDPQGRPTVLDLIPGIRERLYPVGRLDYESEGLLLMTNDGDFAYGLQHPRFGIEKTYRVKVAGRISEAELQVLADGIRLGDGPFRPVSVRLEKTLPDGTWIRLTITEGRNRIIRRAMDAMGHVVRRLIRIDIGGVRLDKLGKGEFRDLTAHERERLAIFLKKFS